ncbi:hypothetical protein [Aquidulcibacter sp.]|uniref:hypothetical protein n=1 Tax=Aquidulcibacter sp. TaxID=2052990 RepID=UPI0028A9C0A5|nr:hypothetical protein [Aquidulcibacter sp.]
MTNTPDTRPTVSPIEGDFTLMPTKLAEALTALVPLAEAACDYADANCRAFPIATAPKDRWIDVWDQQRKSWSSMYISGTSILNPTYTHWREPTPPPTNPPLPAVFTQLGQALEKIKEGKA